MKCQKMTAKIFQSIVIEKSFHAHNLEASIKKVITETTEAI